MLAIGLSVFAYFLFSVLDASVKWLAIAGLSALQLAFMRYATALVLSMVMILRGGSSLNRFDTHRRGLVVLRSFLLMCATLLNFLALKFIPLTLTSTIAFAAPMLICALSGPLLMEKVGAWRWSAIVVGFIGVLVAIRPFDAEFHWAVLLSLGSMSCFSLYMILTRKLAGEVATDTLQFYAAVVGAVILLPVAIYFWVWPQTQFEWVLMLLLGVLGWFGHQLLTSAHRFAEASSLTPYSYVFMVFMTIWSAVIFNQTPDGYTIIGAIIVVTAGLIIWFRERRLGIQRKNLRMPGG